MKIAVFTRGESDLLNLLTQHAETVVFDFEAAPCLNAFDAVAILGGSESEPVILPADTRIVVEAARAAGKRIFTEWCGSIGGTYAANTHGTVFSRMVYTADDGRMPRGALLDDHDNRYISYVFHDKNAVPYLAFGGHMAKHDILDEMPSFSPDVWTLFQNDPFTLVCGFRLCNYVKARFAPKARWDALAELILSYLLGHEVRVKTVATVSTDNPAKAPAEVFRDGLAWFENAAILLQNGKGGVIEGLRHNILPDGRQLTFETVRNDCSGEVGGAYFFDWLLHDRESSLIRYKNLQSFCFGKLQVKEGPHRGMMRWTTTAWGTCYQDDAARSILGTLLQMQLTEDRQYLPEVCEALDYLLQTTGTDGLRIFRTDIPTLSPERIAQLATQPADFPSAHHNGYYMATLLMAYRMNGEQRYFDTALRGLGTLMAAFPDTIREHSETQELCRLVLPLAVLYEITGEEAHKAWLYTVCDALERFRHPCGGYLEYDTGYRAACSRTAGDESSLLADNGDPVMDLLYSANWLPLGFAAAYKATGDIVFKERWQSLTALLSRVQMRSADARLDGCWCRGIDLDRMEVYGMPHDVDWGPCAVESGWTVGEILMGIGYGLYLRMDA